MKNQILGHPTGVLYVYGHDNKGLIVTDVPKSGRTSSLKEHPIAVAFRCLRLDLNYKMYQLIDGNTKIASWPVAVFLPLGFNEDNKVQRPVGTTTTNVTSERIIEQMPHSQRMAFPCTKNRMEIRPQAVENPVNFALLDVALLPRFGYERACKMPQLKLAREAISLPDTRGYKVLVKLECRKILLEKERRRLL